ncbi:hypothetical protein EJ07DRAFT_115264, partial [Lizonia empirigonia]
PTAALALVSARASPPSNTTTSTSTTTTTTNETTPTEDEDEDDADLRRAKDLVRLHYEVREPCKTGELSRGLAEARRDVERALRG